MIDLKILRENPELVKNNAKLRGCDVDIDALVALDKEYLDLTRDIENLRAERNRLSKECQKNPEARETVKQLKVTLGEKEARQTEVKALVDEKITWLPNFLAADVPMGETDADNVAIRFVGEKPQFPFQARDHQAVGEILGIFDTERGAKVAQSGF
jgi:seryl-tRNA synthetase